MIRAGCCLLWLVVVFSFAQADEKTDADLKLSPQEQQLLDLTNKERAKEELPPLTPNPVLFKIARAHSANMAKQEKMEHKLDGKGPADRAKDAGYRYARVGENVAWTEGGSLKEVVKGWMESEGHRANILHKDYREIGLGIVEDKKGEQYLTQVFGRQLRMK